MSSLLVNGVIRIQKQKAIYLLSDIVEVLSQVKKPLFLSDLRGLETPNSDDVIFKKVGKRSRKRQLKVPPKDTPESQIQKIVNAEKISLQEIVEVQVAFEDTSRLARTDDITIRDNQLQRVFSLIYLFIFLYT